MNELTKEELIYLFETLEWITEDFREPDSTYRIKDKIQSMIDNYCEHGKKNIIEYVSEKIIEKHKTCLTDQFDNGYFWAMKDIQNFLLS